jgi:hypothetical protein
MPSVPVTVFNANTNQVSISVNTGAPIAINGTGPNANWVPQQPSPNPLSYSNGYPAANVFGSLAPNQVSVIVDGVPISQPLQISIPQSGPVFSLQLYIFFNTTSTVSWTMLSGGQPVASGMALTNSALEASARATARPSSGKKSSAKKAKKR